MPKNICFFSLFIIFLIAGCNKDSVEDEINLTGNSIIESEIFSLVNTHRESLGKNTLIESTLVQKHAKEHNIYMINMGKLSHDNFPKRASAISEKTEASYIAENVGKDYPTAGEMFNNWLASDGHKQNIEGDYTHTGISVIKNDEGKYYYTQLFYK